MAENKPFIKKNFMTEHRKQIVSFASHANSVYYENKTLDEVLHEIIEALENIPSDLNTCSKISLECDPTTYEFKAILYNKDDEAIYTSNTIDLPIESLVLSVSYDADNNTIIIEYKDGEIVEIPVSSMTSGLQEKIDLNNKLPAEFISGLAMVAITGDYEDLSNKPSINGVTLIGNKTSEELGIVPGGTGNYNDLENKPQVNGVTLSGDTSLDALGIWPVHDDPFHSQNYYTKDEIDASFTAYVPAEKAAVKVGIGKTKDNSSIFVYLEDASGDAFPIEDGLPISDIISDAYVTASYNNANKQIVFIKASGANNPLSIGDITNGLASESYVQEQIAPLATKTELVAKQDKLIAGANITIDPNTNVISATGGGGGGGTEYTAVDPILISGTSIMFNRILDETITPGEAGATNRLPTNKAVTEYIADNVPTMIDEYAQVHSQDWGKTYVGENPIAVDGLTIKFEYGITAQIDDNNKTSTLSIPTNNAITSYVDNEIIGAKGYADEKVSEAKNYANEKANEAKEYAEDYADDKISSVYNYIDDNKGSWGKTYTGVSPITITGTQIGFDKTFIDEIQDIPGETQSIPLAGAITSYVKEQIGGLTPSSITDGLLIIGI